MSEADRGLDLGSATRRGALFAVVAVVVVVAVSTLPGVDDVRDRLADADPIWLVGVVWFAISSMLGYVRALWAVFDRVLPWRRALVLGLAEQGANVLIPAGGAGGPALGAYVMQRLGVPGELAAQRHAALHLPGRIAPWAIAPSETSPQGEASPLMRRPGSRPRRGSPLRARRACPSRRRARRSRG